MKTLLINLTDSPSLIFPVMQEILISNGHECKNIQVPLEDASDKYIEQIAKQIVSICPESKLIGISCITNTYLACINLIKNLRKFSKSKIVVGGVHPTVKPNEFNGYADYVCVGEGEEALLELVNKLDKNKRTDNIPNIYTFQNGKLKINSLRPLLKNLNNLPTPKFNFNETYLENQGKIYKLADKKELIKKFYSKYYFIITSRGCPYRCTYCLNNALIKISSEYIVIRRRNNEHILNELRNFKKIIPKGNIIGFVDDDFCAQPLENLKQFCELYKQEINLPFFCASTPSSMNEDKLKVLLNAGLIRLEIGVQTISDRINKEVFGRYATKNQVINLVKILEKYRHKLQICYDFILDNPWETDETRLETLNFILSLKKPFTAFIFSLTTYPGTELFERAKSEGILKKDSDIYKKNHMILENNKINTLWVLYNKYHFHKNIIKLFIANRNHWPLNYILEKSTYLLLRTYNYFYGLKDSLNRKDKHLRDYYLLAPFKLLIKKIKEL